MNDPRIDLGPQLTGADAADCQDALDAIRPIIRVDARLDPHTASAAAAVVNLVARLHPHAAVDGDAPLPPNPWGATSVAHAAELVPRPEPSREPGRDVVIAVGAHVRGDIWIGGDDWTALVSETPVRAASTKTGLGVHAAAALAAAEILKMALGPLGLIQASALPSTVWNLLDYSRSPAPTLDGDETRMPSAWLFGVGSIGSSIAALLSLREPGGRVDVVDTDRFDPARNPYRYPASTLRTEGAKATWAAAMLTDAGWQAEGHDMTVAEWVCSQERPGFDGIAVSSVDRVDGRADVADALARTTLSIGVGGLAFHVQREHPDDDAACPYCQYLAVGSPMSQLAVYEQQTGIPMARIAQLLAGVRLEPHDVDQAVASGRVRAERAGDLVGRRFEDLVRRAYAEATVRTVAGELVAVSSPAVSWLAATIAVAELTKIAKGIPMVDRRVDVDLSGVPAGMTRRLARDRSGRCLCANPFRLRMARRLYAT